MRELTLGSLFDGLYMITNDGKLYSTRTGKWLKPDKDKYGYVYYVVSINSVRYTVKAHRAVAQCFIPNPEGKPTVDHINCITTDNRVCNLRWATHKEQSHNEITYPKKMKAAMERDFRSMGEKINWNRTPVKVTKDNVLIGEYPSLKKAAEDLGISYSKASECANGKRRMTGGYKIWKK